MKNMVQKFRNNLNNVREDEAGDVVQNVLIIAVFVIIVGIVGKVLYTAISDQGNRTSSCIKNVGTNIATSNVTKSCK